MLVDVELIRLDPGSTVGIAEGRRVGSGDRITFGMDWRIAEALGSVLAESGEPIRCDVEGWQLLALPAQPEPQPVGWLA